jgi:chromosome segregation ATPase
MDPKDVTVEILKDIRQEMRETKGELRQTRTELSERIAETNLRIDETNLRLGETNQRIVASEIRIATAITGLAGTVGEMRDAYRASNDLRPRVERCESEIAEIKRRLPDA